MKDITLSDIPCLKDYEEVKKRLFVRLWNKERLQENGAIYEPFQDLYFSCHIDVSDLVGATAFCMVKEGFAECLGVDRKQLLADAVENGTRIRPALTMPIEAYMARLGAPVDTEPENHLMIATTEDFLYGASVVMYPGFLERISGGKNLYLIPSSIHEWLYIEDRGIFTQEELTSLLRSVNSEIVSEEEILSDHLYYYEGKEIRQV